MIAESLFEKRLREARAFEHTSGTLTFSLEIPTRAELRVLVLSHENMGSDAARAACLQAITLGALRSVRGATTRDIGLAGEALPLPETAQVARAIAADNLELLDELQERVNARIRERSEQLEADEKN